MRHTIFLFCFLFLAITKNSSAQTYPVNVTTQLIGSFTGYMEDYTSPVNEQLRILVTQYDLTKPTYNVHFKVRIEGPNILIESKANYYSEVFYIDPGVPQQITGSDLAGLLNAENLNFSGINKNTYQTKALPEGLYTFCFTAYDGTSISKAQVSNASCAMSYFSKSDPPFLNLPLCGSELKPTDPQQITFSWTPLHMGSINAFNTVDYLFELFEVRPSGQNINNIVQTSVPVFSTTTNLTMLNYGITETPLIHGMQYVWRVRAVESSGKESFKNNGFSQVCSFNYGSKYDGIDVKIKLNAIGLLPEVIKAYWDTLDIYNNYHLFVSKVNGNGTWREFKTKKGEQYINIVEPECSYKLYVIGDLDEGGQGKASDTVLVTTPAVKKIVCNDLPPPPPPENGDPLTTASVGMMWSIGQFRMEVLTLENTASPNGRYTGTGKIELLPGYMIAHYFENIRMNNLMQMTHGVVMAESTGMDNWRQKKKNAEQGGDDTGDEITGAVTTDAIISGTISDIKVTNNNDSTATVTITTSEGDKTFENQSLPFTVVDGEGNIFFADKDGTAGKAAKANYLPPLNTQQLDTLSSIGLATFTANSNQNYGFDFYQDVFSGKSIIEKEYQVLSTKYDVQGTKNQESTTSNYRVSQKSIKASGYDKVNVSITLNDPSIKADSIVFVSSKGTRFLSTKSQVQGTTQSNVGLSTLDFQLNLIGGPANDAQNIYALYKNGNTLKSIGKIKVAGYGLQKKKMVLVEVGKSESLKSKVARVAELQKNLNAIYKQACVEFTITTDSLFTNTTWDANNDGNLDVTGSGLFSQYTDEMKALNKAYSIQRTVDNASIYLFVLPAAKDASVVGDMPRGKQFGYLFANKLNTINDWANTIAHEAAHGAGKFKHTFDADINLPEKTTSNLMDYKNGTNLYKYQWDQLQDPGELTALFDEDEDAMLDRAAHYGLTPSGIVFDDFYDNKQTRINGGEVVRYISTNNYFIDKIEYKNQKYFWDAASKAFANGTTNIYVKKSDTKKTELVNIFKSAGDGCDYNYMLIAWAGNDTLTTDAKSLVEQKLATAQNPQWLSHRLGIYDPACNNDFLKDIAKLNKSCPEKDISDGDKLLQDSINITNGKNLAGVINSVCLSSLRKLSYNTIEKLFVVIAKQSSIKNASEVALLRLMNAIASNDYSTFFTFLESNNNGQIKHLIAEMDDKSIYPWDGDNYTNFIAALIKMYNTNPGSYIDKLAEPGNTKLLSQTINLNPVPFKSDLDIGIFGNTTPLNQYKYVGKYNSSTGNLKIERQELVQTHSYVSSENIPHAPTWVTDETLVEELSPLTPIVITTKDNLPLVETALGEPAIESTNSYVVPAIFLKYKADKELINAVENAGLITFDVITIAASGGMAISTKVHWAKRIWALTEVIGAVGNIAVNTGYINTKDTALTRAVEIYNITMGLIGLKNLAAATPSMAKGIGNVYSSLSQEVKDLIKNNKSIKALITEKYHNYLAALKNADNLSVDEQLLQHKQEKVWKALGAEGKVIDNINGLFRGVTKQDFINSVKDFANNANPEIADQAWELWKQKKWSELEKLFNKNNINNWDGTIYPPNNGAINTIKKTLDPSNYGGELYIDRYGAPTGNYVSMADVAFEQRALPYPKPDLPPKKYKVINPILNVEEGQIIPWFNQPGMGMQFKLEKPVQFYLDKGYIIQIQ